MTTKQPYPEEFKIEAVRPLGVTEADCLKRRCPALFKLGIKRNWVNQSVDKSHFANLSSMQSKKE
jgi:hypothetical protein